ncbi:methyltransferase C9orf114 [Chlorella sorokiniana]|uniref:Methyltransferase C9orf114 n=1 Tax=Chlorella sorokiniana TaxID=3076 RepID=A0A2P6U1R6_CHLSO|nr:methyltransferase C9orf114 [Chlorella sorokiniana]|eukprot:PRW60255.1 methyltransferase C9orf114 [Chlorella sorokiniana]
MGSDKKSKKRDKGERSGDREKKRKSYVALDAPAEQPSTSGRPYTLSITVAASCIENAQNLELATLLAGQIARAAAIFNVDEVVVLDDALPAAERQPGHVSSAAALFARVLQFMETPQYLKKALIPMHPDLKYAGVLPPLDAPHHLRSTEWGPYREGVVKRSAVGQGSWLDVGLDRDAHIPQAAKQGVRLTLAMGDQPAVVTLQGQEVLQAALALPSDPRERAGLYWGYTTRIVPSLAALLDPAKCPFEGGYDLTIGTSERGEQTPPCELWLAPSQHRLVVFGGPQGLEHALQQDGVAGQHSSPAELFDRYLNTCFDQGSRTIRSEEAILISLAFLQPALSAAAAGTH